LARNFKGEVLAGLKRNDAAIESFREAIGLFAELGPPPTHMAAAELTAGRNETRSRRYSKASGLERCPTSEGYLAGLTKRLGRVD